MSDLPDKSGVEWQYLAGVLDSSNHDEDLTDIEQSELQKSKKPKSHLEAQILNLVSPNVDLSNISEITVGKVHLHGHFTQSTGRYLQRGLHITEAIFSDNSGSVRIVWWNQPYKASSLIRGVDYELRGSFGLSHQRFQISNAKVRPLSEGCEPFSNKESKK